jgi:hypothetical protein
MSESKTAHTLYLESKSPLSYGEWAESNPPELENFAWPISSRKSGPCSR